MNDAGKQPEFNSTPDTSFRGLKVLIGSQPRTSIPDHPGYQFARRERLRFGQLWLAGLLLVPIWFVTFIVLVRLLGGPEVYSGEITFGRTIAAILVLVAVIAIHEGIHALAGCAFGGRPWFGVGIGYFFITFAQPFSRAGFLTIALAPVVVISLGSIILGAIWPAVAGWALLGSLFNISGSGGDLWMTKRIAIQPRDAIFYDLADGFAVLFPDNKLNSGQDTQTGDS